MVELHVGILGHSVEGAALCLREYAISCTARGIAAHPDVTLDCIAIERSMDDWRAGRPEAVRARLARSVDRLAAAGADFFACPANTAHAALEAAGPPLALPGLHIIEEVADAAARQGYGKVAVLGTAFTMKGAGYPDSLARRDIVAVMPQGADFDAVHEMIFTDLVHGIVSPETMSRFVDIAGRLADRGCDAVALACTEIPLALTPANSPLPVLDSCRLLAEAAADVATRARPIPHWRGGPVHVEAADARDGVASG